MTTRDLVNHILLTGQKGYKDMEDGNRISDKMTLLVKEHIKAEADKMVSERLGEALTDWADYWNELETGHACIMKEDIDEYLKTRDSHE